MEKHLIYSGKVRQLYVIDEGHVLIETSDRVSSFDRHIGIIKNKGLMLNKITKWWFEKTKHIIDNHMIMTHKNTSLVKNKPIMLEFVVRGYITGSMYKFMDTL